MTTKFILSAIIATAVCGCSVLKKQPPAPNHLPLLPKAIDTPPAEVKPTPQIAPAVKPQPQVKPKKAVPAPVPPAVVKVKPVKPLPVVPEKVVKPEVEVKPEPRRSPEKYRHGAGLWKAFSRLSQEEQQRMMKLQRDDPENFRKIMQQKADSLYEQERARQQELESLAAKYRATANEAEKEQLKALLRKMLQEDFNQRLIDSRRDLEANRRRLKKMESELQKREKNCTAIVDAILSDRLAGKPRPPRHTKPR